MSTVDENRVILTGENSVIRLSSNDSDTFTTNATFWRLLSSPGEARLRLLPRMRDQGSRGRNRPSLLYDRPISYKSGYTYLGPDDATQRQRLLEGTAKTPRMETGAQVMGRAAQSRQMKHRRYEFAGWEFKPDKQGVRGKRAILRELPND
jgi:hypothetical protein